MQATRPSRSDVHFESDRATGRNGSAVATAGSRLAAPPNAVNRNPLKLLQLRRRPDNFRG
ncbi:MAG: hypothetical protein ABFC77_02740 [Thermoguttaceae bacterium]